MTKECRGCGEVKDIEEFLTRKRGSRQVHVSYCYPCWREHQNEYQQGYRAVQRPERFDWYELAPPHPLERLVNEKAACRGDVRFANAEGGRNYAGIHHVLKETCATCPVVRECRVVGDHVEENRRYIVGIWGGELPHERHERRRRGNRNPVAA